jgi:hypothetical protein
MKLVTFGVSTPVGQIQRIGAMHLNKLIDLNMGYTCYLADKHGSGQSYEVAAAMLPPDMIAFFRRGKEGKERAEMTIACAAKRRVKGGLLGPRGEKVVYEMNEVKRRGRTESMWQLSCPGSGRGQEAIQERHDR